MGLLGCADAEDAREGIPFEATLAECGDSLESLLAERAPPGSGASGPTPPFGAPYSEALAEWLPERGCGLGAFTGACADGKRLLYRNGGFTSEIRYYEGERLVGVVSSGDVGFCPSVCPFSRYHGDPDSVRCDAPALVDLCASSALDVAEAESWLPFANGSPPGGCWQ